MRIWSLHPKYLDPKGLVALWRESLLAQKVLQGQTRGYRNHPQLMRFKQCSNPVASIATYLRVIQQEATQRGYSFDLNLIARGKTKPGISCSRGQLLYEWDHLLAKLEQRDPKRLAELSHIDCPDPHPLFRIVEGDVETWEVSFDIGHLKIFI